MFTSTIDGELDPYLDALAERVPGGRRVVGPLRRLSRAARTRARSARCVRAHPGPTRRCSVARCRTPPSPRCARRWRCASSVIDFAVEAQGLDAATLQARFRADLPSALGRPPNVPRRTARVRADIDLDDIQGNVLRGYTMPAAAYLFLRIVDVEQGARADAAHARARTASEPRVRKWSTPGPF